MISWNQKSEPLPDKSVVFSSSFDKEIKLLNGKIAKLHKMIEKSVIPKDNPDVYELKAIKNFESKRKKGDTRFVPLDSLS